jgi:hypothetical protein
MNVLEFWPDYGGSLLWSAAGQRLALEDTPLSGDLVERARRWVARYDDSKLPWEPTPDAEWLTEGRGLFQDLRRELLNHGFDLHPNEDFWALPPGTMEIPPDQTLGR